MCIKVNRILDYLQNYVDSGTRWGDIPLTDQVDVMWILYNDNKRHYDKRSSMTNEGIANLVMEDVYRQYEFLEGTLIPNYDYKEAPQGDR